MVMVAAGSGTIGIVFEVVEVVDVKRKTPNTKLYRKALHFLAMSL
jgi:hypothetical protein